MELATRRLMNEWDATRRRLEAAQERITELEAAVRDLSGGDLDPVAMQRRLAVLETENSELRERLGEAGARVHAIVSRLQFLEEEA
ncbi:MAG: hypothetical protein ACRELD_01680 [Longimicrobiales bacterium]